MGVVVLYLFSYCDMNSVCEILKLFKINATEELMVLQKLKTFSFWFTF